MKYEDLINRGEEYYDKGEYDRAIENYDKAIELDPKNASAYNNRGIAYDKKSDYDQAIEDYDKAIELDPNDAAAYNNRGIAYNNKLEYDRAIEDFDKAIELDPNDASAYNNRGIAYNNKGEYDRAIEDYTKAIELDPNKASAYNNRGNAYDNKGEYDRAIEDYTKAIELDPNKASAYNNRGNAYRKLGDYDRAIEDYDKAIELDPQDAFAYNNCGIAYFNKDEYNQAIEDFDEAIRLNPNDAAAYNNRGIVFFQKGDYVRAIEDFDEAIKLNPKHAAAYLCRGLSCHNKGNYNQAIEDFDKAIKLNPNDANAYSFRGDTYLKNNDYNNATKDYAKTMELGLKDLIFINDFLGIVENHGETLKKEAKNELLKSSHYLVRLVGDILCATNKKEHFQKYIRLIREIYAFQGKLEAPLQRKLEKQKNSHFYQYMKKEAFLKIIKNPVIWLTPACYQNDPDEGKCLFGYFSSSSSNELLKKILEELSSVEQPDLAFIRSFSECKDDLKMWNSSYGKTGAGVCLGVPFSKLKEANSHLESKKTLSTPFLQNEEKRPSAPSSTKDEFEMMPVANLYFAKVFYLKTSKNKYLKNKYLKNKDLKDITHALDEFNDEFLGDQKNAKNAKRFLPQIFLPISHLVKKNTYGHEKEWRLLYITSIKQGKLGRYIQPEPLRIETEKILFNGKNGKEELWLGPRIPDLEKQKIEHLFEYHEKGDFVDIHTSTVRFRG